MNYRAMLLALFMAPSVWAHGMAVPPAASEEEEAVQDVARMRFCQRVRDMSLQALYDRDRGRPLKLFDEDGSDGPRITNIIARQIYAEPQISTPKRVEAFARARCNELLLEQSQTK